MNYTITVKVLNMTNLGCICCRKIVFSYRCLFYSFLFLFTESSKFCRPFICLSLTFVCSDHTVLNIMKIIT